MVNYYKSRQKEVHSVITKKSEVYHRLEGHSYYRMEDMFFRQIFSKNENVLNVAKQLVGKKLTYKKVSPFIKELLEEFHLEDVPFKRTVKKNGNSFYSVRKRCVFINEFSLKSDSLENTITFLYILLHEYAHAYNCRYFDAHSHHDSSFFNNHLEILSYFLNEEPEYFLDSVLEVELNDLFNNIGLKSLREHFKDQFYFSLLSDNELRYIKGDEKDFYNFIEKKKEIIPHMNVKEYDFTSDIEVVFSGEFNLEVCSIKLFNKGKDNSFFTFIYTEKIHKKLEQTQKEYIEHGKEKT